MELRRKEEKDAAEALKRDQELREAKRQQQRLNFLLTQTELYSHFMQNKMAGLPAHLAQDPAGVGPDGDSSSKFSAEDAAEEEALKEEALRAAEKAVSQQMNRTNTFDNESQKLRQAVGGEGAVTEDEAMMEGGADIDLLHP